MSTQPSAAQVPASAAIEGTTPIEHNKLGVLLFILSEVVFFGSLILSYIYYRASIADVASQSRQLDVLVTEIFSIFLFSSSFTIWRADKAQARGSRTAFLVWLGATIVLGLVFIVGQGLEYVRLFEENTTASSSLFGSAFFTLTGFHAFHVLAGLVALSIVLGLGIKGAFDGGKSAAVESVSLYWHFVDAVWVVLFSVIYLWALVG